MIRKLCFLTNLIYLSSFLCILSAQTTTYSVRQPDFEVSAFAQDKEGYIWVATSRGLARFNGSGYMTWNSTGETGGLPNDKILSLLYDGQDRMWVGTECGFGVMKDGIHTHNGEAVYNPITAIREMGDEHILALGKDGLVKMHKDGFRTAAVHYSPGTSWLEHILVTQRGDVWFACSSNDSTYLYILDGDLDVRAKTYLGKGLEVAGICEHPSGDVYLATENNVTVLDVETGKVNEVNALDSVLGGAAGIHFMLPYRGDQLLFGIAGKGFYAYVPSDGKLRHIIHQQTLSSDRYVCFVDKDDRIWLSDSQSAIRTYNPKGVYIHFNPQGEDKSAEVSHLYFDNEGWLWVNVEGRICSMDADTGDIRWVLDDETACRVSFIDSRGRLWALFGQNDVRQYNLRAGKASLARKYTVSDSVFSISEGKGGRIWLSSVRKVFVIDDNGGVSAMRPSGSPVFSMLISDARTHRVFMFSINDGLYELHEDASVTKIETGDIKGISYVMTASDGAMWLGTYNEGVIRLDEETGEIRQFGNGEGLTDLSIKSIVEDSEGNIWFSTRSNVVRYDKESGTLSAVHDDWYLEGRSYSLVASAVKGGLVFFGGNAGITRIDTSLPFPEPKEKTLNLEQVLINGKEVGMIDGKIVLTRDDGMLALRFAGINYDSGPYLTYSYRLEGHDRNWTYVHGEGLAVYTHIPAGEYVFRARVSGHDGVWSANEIEIPLYVKRNPLPIWAVLLIGFGVLLIFGQFFILHRRLAVLSEKSDDEDSSEEKDEEVWYETSGLNDADQVFITKVISYLESNLDNEKFTVNDLAKSMGMSYSSLYAKIKSLTGVTPQYFMTSHRMKKAEAFLKSGSFSVSEVAYKVGSSSPMTFSREFKKYFGYPPSQLLKEQQ